MTLDKLLCTQLGSNVKRYRISSGMTQSELAEKVGVSVTTIANLENGTFWIKAENLANLAIALNVNPGVLLVTDSPEFPSLPEDNDLECRIEEINKEAAGKITKLVKINSGLQSYKLKRDERLPQGKIASGK